MKKSNIILIGMPASGKSTAGVILAKLLGMDFIDADLLIQKRANMTLPELISQEGPQGFIEIENWFNSEIQAENTVISTGGSAVYGVDAMKHFQEIGTIIYLEVDYYIISNRIMDIEGRGVVLKDGQTLKDLYAERIPLYEKYADITIPEKSSRLEEVVQKIASAWRKYNKSE